MKHTDIREIFRDPAPFLGQTVTVCGWVRTARDSKNIAFIEINDGTYLNNLQLVVDKEKFDDAAYKDAMAVGASVKAEGTLVASERNVCEVELTKLTVLGTCDES